MLYRFFLRLLRALLDPHLIVRKIVKAAPFVPFRLRCELDAIDCPAYAYGVMQAASLANALNVGRITLIEFGVAGGRGLLALERIARKVAKITGVHFDIFGFDSETGLPEPVDYRDMPYVYRPGFYKMDEDRLKRKLKVSSLVLGDVEETVPEFLAEGQVSPIGFISFDLDLYSSTKHALRIFDSGSGAIMPRVFCYFDDTVGPDMELPSEYTGELAAINEFNAASEERKLCKINGLIYKRIIRAVWCEQMYVLHDFKHPLYDAYVFPDRDRQLPLR